MRKMKRSRSACTKGKSDTDGVGQVAGARKFSLTHAKGKAADRCTAGYAGIFTLNVQREGNRNCLAHAAQAECSIRAIPIAAQMADCA